MTSSYGNRVSRRLTLETANSAPHIPEHVLMQTYCNPCEHQLANSWSGFLLDTNVDQLHLGPADDPPADLELGGGSRGTYAWPDTDLLAQDNGMKIRPAAKVQELLNRIGGMRSSGLPLALVVHRLAASDDRYKLKDCKGENQAPLLSSDFLVW